MRRWILVTCLFGSLSADPAFWEARFELFLRDVRENSINNIFKWGEGEWDLFLKKQKRRLPIESKENFFKVVTEALLDLGDGHSFLLRNVKESTKFNKLPEVKLLEGVGLITLPSFWLPSTSQEALLSSQSWVESLHRGIEEVEGDVTKGWIIDLRENRGGNEFPMLVALSYFWINPKLRGGYGRDHKPWRFSFDGQSLVVNGEKVLSYPKGYSTGQNRLPVITLIGPNTGSSGECMALCLKEQPRCKLVGQPTAGMTTGNVRMELPNGLGSYFLAASYALGSDDKPLWSFVVEPHIRCDLIGEELVEFALEMLAKRYGG